MDLNDVDAKFDELFESQRLLDDLRRQYATIRQSRYYGLRSLLRGARKMLEGRSAPPVGEGNFVPSKPLMRQAFLGTSEDQLLSGWRWRMAGANPLSSAPEVSIIIPAYNHLDATVTCLQSIVDTWFESLRVQIILVDDCSSDRTRIVAAELDGLDFVRNESNLGYIRSCNRALDVARGEFICYLNNDTAVTNGWLEELLLTARKDESVGVVGAKLVYPDGRLQEAGGLLWDDGSGWNYGRLDDPADPKYNYTRDVDYCSGAALLVRTDLVRRLGGFSEEYAPAYFEDADLCFAAREFGYRVVYQPKSVVVHYEGVSSGTSTESGTKRYQLINKPKFVHKWQKALRQHLRHDPERGMEAARRVGRGKTLLMIDNYVPEYDKDSGSNKLRHLIREFQNIGYDVIYAPDNYHRSEPYTSFFQREGVEVLYGTDRGTTLEHAIRDRMRFTDLVWIGRPEIAARWLPVIRAFPNVPVVYDTHDLHYVRVKRELELFDIRDEARWAQWRSERTRELDIIRSVDVAITVTETERRLLADEEGIEHAFVVPNVHETFERVRGFNETSGVIFIGGYQHGPNADGAVWLCNEIMPLVWAQRPEIKVTLLGSKPTEAVRSLANNRILVTGYLHDVDGYFENARLFVAPLRFGAGLKGKIGQAFAFRLPTVTTTIGAEGFGIVEGRHALVADRAEDFAQAILRAYDDPVLWARLSEGAAECIAQFSPENARTRLRKLAAFADDRRKP